MTVNQVYKSSAIWQADGADGDVVFTAHYRTTTVNSPISNPEEAQEIADQVVAELEAGLIPVMSDKWTLLNVDVIGISDPTVQATSASGTSGSLNEQVVALRSAPVVKLATGLRGRSYNGRMFLPAPSEEQQSGGVLGTNPQANIQAGIRNIQLLTGSPSTNEYSLTVFSKTLTGTGPIVDNLVTLMTLNFTLGGQRGRQTV